MEILKKFLEEKLNISGDKVIKDFIDYNRYLTDWNSKVNVMSRNYSHSSCDDVATA